MIFGSIAYLPRGSDFSQPSGVCVCVCFLLRLSAGTLTDTPRLEWTLWERFVFREKLSFSLSGLLTQSAFVSVSLFLVFTSSFIIQSFPARVSPTCESFSTNQKCLLEH